MLESIGRVDRKGRQAAQATADTIHTRVSAHTYGPAARSRAHGNYSRFANHSNRLIGHVTDGRYARRRPTAIDDGAIDSGAMEANAFRARRDVRPRCTSATSQALVADGRWVVMGRYGKRWERDMGAVGSLLLVASRCARCVRCVAAVTDERAGGRQADLSSCTNMPSRYIYIYAIACRARIAIVRNDDDIR